MGPLHSPREYLFQLQAMSSGEAKRIWRQHIKEQWNHQCAYCGSDQNITIDHIIPRNERPDLEVVCCCHSCNQDKKHTPWEEWYLSQEFFSIERYETIKEWMKPDPPTNLYTYRKRRNNAS